VTQTVTKYVVSDFTWKDPAAAQRADVAMDYVTRHGNRGFKLKLYHALATMDDAGLMPGIRADSATTTVNRSQRQQVRD